MKNISIEELEKLLTTPPTDTLFIDVRSKEEFVHERIDGFINIPLDEIVKHSGEFADKKVILCCRTGIRSDVAAKNILANNNNLDITNFQDGLLGWKHAGKPTIYDTTNFFSSIKHLSIEQQIFILFGAILLVAGLTVFNFLVIGQTIVLLMAIVLMSVGVTGMKPLIKFFEKLPWNKK